MDGPLVPHDILRISGEEAVQHYLTREIQNVYRSQRVTINDKHIEIIVAQMLRKVRVESGGDTGLLEGSVMDKFEFRKVNDQLSGSVKVSDPGDTDFTEGEIVRREIFEQKNAQFEAAGGRPAKFVRPAPATASTQLLGITKASVQSSSFISAASFQETTKVLTEAALAGKVDRLVGLKENVILGHLVPAGTGFRTYQDSEVRLRPSALSELAAQRAGPETDLPAFGTRWRWWRSRPDCARYGCCGPGRAHVSGTGTAVRPGDRAITFGGPLRLLGTALGGS